MPCCGSENRGRDRSRSPLRGTQALAVAGPQAFWTRFVGAVIGKILDICKSHHRTRLRAPKLRNPFSARPRAALSSAQPICARQKISHAKGTSKFRTTSRRQSGDRTKRPPGIHWTAAGCSLRPLAGQLDSRVRRRITFAQIPRPVCAKSSSSAFVVVQNQRPSNGSFDIAIVELASLPGQAFIGCSYCRGGFCQQRLVSRRPCQQAALSARPCQQRLASARTRTF